MLVLPRAGLSEPESDEVEEKPASSQPALAISKSSRVSVMIDTLIHSSPFCATMSTKALRFLTCCGGGSLAPRGPEEGPRGRVSQ